MSERTHDELVERALRWLRSRRCAPIFHRCASCSEIPDAIGWSGSYKHHGSIVIECKASRADFYADKKKRFRWKHPKWGFSYRAGRLSRKEAEKEGWLADPIPLMGNYRFYLCAPGTITLELLAEHAPDHGLLIIEGRRIAIAKMAPRIGSPNYEAEVRFLRFAIINRKDSEHREEDERPTFPELTQPEAGGQ